MNPEKIRKDFPIFQENPDLVYLDNAATSQKPRKVINAIEDFYSSKNANIGRGIYNLANESTQEYRKSREKVADFVGAEKDEIIFVRNTSEAENLLAESLNFEGDIVLSEMSHHSEQLPWRRKARQEDKDVEYLNTENGEISLKSAREKISGDTGLVAISHISNVFGTENPVKDIIEMAHEKDALVVLDAAQSAPDQKLDVKELDVDFLCFSGHKMLGPSGIGVLYGRKEMLEEMEPYQVGGGMISRVEKDSVTYADVPAKFEAGTPNISGAVGLKAAIEYLEDVGMEQISEHVRMLAGKIKENLESIEGVQILSPEDANLVSFTTKFAHPHDVAEILNNREIAVRAGDHCAQPQMEELGINGTVRASPYIYNTEKDITRLVEGVKEAKKVFS